MVSVTLDLHRVAFALDRKPDVHALHRLLWAAFPSVPASTPSPFLFRADAERKGRAVRVVALVQTRTTPDWSLVEAAVESAQHEHQLELGQTLRFFLRANPTQARKGRGEPATAQLEGEAFRARRGRRVAILSEPERLRWLDRKGALHGFRVVERDVRAGGETHPWPALQTKNTHTALWGRNGLVRHDGVDFEGLLEITDVDRFAETLRAGIGSAKAFGYGLLSVRV